MLTLFLLIWIIIGLIILIPVFCLGTAAYGWMLIISLLTPKVIIVTLSLITGFALTCCLVWNAVLRSEERERERIKLTPLGQQVLKEIKRKRVEELLSQGGRGWEPY